MRKARVYLHGKAAGVLEESGENKYRFRYLDNYDGPPLSLTIPRTGKDPGYGFEGFPPFFEGLLPEGEMLEGLLRQAKLDRDDLFGQLLTVGGELVGAVTVEEIV